jgi:hypothetical protein
VQRRPEPTTSVSLKEKRQAEGEQEDIREIEWQQKEAFGFEERRETVATKIEQKLSLKDDQQMQKTDARRKTFSPHGGDQQGEQKVEAAFRIGVAEKQSRGQTNLEPKQDATETPKTAAIPAKQIESEEVRMAAREDRTLLEKPKPSTELTMGLQQDQLDQVDVQRDKQKLRLTKQQKVEEVKAEPRVDVEAGQPQPEAVHEILEAKVVSTSHLESKARVSASADKAETMRKTSVRKKVADEAEKVEKASEKAAKDNAAVKEKTKPVDAKELAETLEKLTLEAKDESGWKTDKTATTTTTITTTAITTTLETKPKTTKPTLKAIKETEPDKTQEHETKVIHRFPG